MRALADVIEVGRICMRHAGNKVFADVAVAAPRALTFVPTYELTAHKEQLAQATVRTLSPHGNIDGVVYVEPAVSSTGTV